MLSQALAGRRLEDYETEHRRKDGSLVPVSLTVSPMRDSRRAIVGASVIVRDRTERKRAEEAMREVQEAFRRAFEDAPIGMALFGVEADERGRLLQVNHSLCEITGYSARELRVDDAGADHPSRTTWTTERPLLDRLLSGEIPNYQLEKRFLRGDGGDGLGDAQRLDRARLLRPPALRHRAGAGHHPPQADRGPPRERGRRARAPRDRARALELGPAGVRLRRLARPLRAAAHGVELRAAAGAPLQRPARLGRGRVHRVSRSTA